MKHPKLIGSIATVHFCTITKRFNEQLSGRSGGLTTRNTRKYCTIILRFY